MVVVPPLATALTVLPPLDCPNARITSARALLPSIGAIASPDAAVVTNRRRLIVVLQCPFAAHCRPRSVGFG
jgi:hypothetical protein